MGGQEQANSSNIDVDDALKRWEPSQIELGNNLKYLESLLGIGHN